MSVDLAYRKIINDVLAFGVYRPNRTGVDTLAIPSAMFQYDMAEGFPILSNKKISFKTSKVELEGFLKGITDKAWYQKNGCTIWDEWCNPEHVAGLTGEHRLKCMREEMDLGPIYGSQWRYFNGCGGMMGGDQLLTLVSNLRDNPDSRRMIVSAWNPLDLSTMALPPCHFSWQVLVIDGYLHLNWNQRSVDVFLGLPYNICFYGLILELLARQFNYKCGMLTGFLGDTHIYDNHMDAVDEYKNRHRPDESDPILEISSKFESILDFDHKHVKLAGYAPHPAIPAPIAV